MAKQLTALIIMDGFGLSNIKDANAVEMADTSNFDRLWATYPHVAIHASGLDVGLPEGQMGNSEVGHLNIGAGRIVYQDFTRISKAIQDGDFFENEAFLDAIAHVKKHGSKLHLLGLVSEGGVHSHMEHLYALVELAKKKGLPQVYIHAFMDGRDVPPASGKATAETLDSKLRQMEFGKVASVSGRYYAMDRDKRWERVQKAYNALVLGEGEIADTSSGCNGAILQCQ